MATYINNLELVLADDLAEGFEQTMVVTDGSRIPVDVSPEDPLFVTADYEWSPGNYYQNILAIVGVVGTVPGGVEVNIQRAIEGTPAAFFAAGTIMQGRLTAAQLNDYTFDINFLKGIAKIPVGSYFSAYTNQLQAPLYVNIGNITGYFYESWVITIDEEVAPGDQDPRWAVAPVRNFLYLDEYYTPYTLRLWLKDNGNITPVPTGEFDPDTGDVIYEIYLTAAWGKAPPNITDYVADMDAVPNPGSDARVLFTEEPNPVPVTYDLYKVEGVEETLLRKSVRNNDVIENLPPGSYQTFIASIDSQLRRVDSNDSLIEIGTGTQGMITFSDWNEVIEGGQIIVNMAISPRSPDEEVSIEVSTKDGGAQENINYVPKLERVSFPTGVSTATFTINTINNSEGYNRNVQFYMVSGSEQSDSGSNPPIIPQYPDNADLAMILGSVEPIGNAFLQEQVDQGGQEHHIISFSLDDFSNQDDQENPSSQIWDQYDGTVVGDSSADAIVGSSGPLTWAGTGDAQDAEPIGVTSRRDYPVVFNQLGPHTLHLRGRCVYGWTNTAFIGFDGGDNLVDAEGIVDRKVNVAIHSPSYWDWSTNANRVVTFNVVKTGEHILNLYRANKSMILDRIVISNRVDYDPKLEGDAVPQPPNSHSMGPPDSIKGGGEGIPDYEGNPSVPSVPDPDGVPFDPTELSPLDGAQNVSTLSTLVATWPLNTVALNVQITVRDSSGNVIAGDTTND